MRLSIALLFVFMSWCWSQNVVRHVNPFVGTAGGNTFPGAVRPWGMTSVSPHTSSTPSGYTWNSPNFYGFGHVHLSGTGCADLGSVLLTAVRTQLPSDPGNYRCSPCDESASPGYYRVRLREPEILAEVTATVHCGFTRFHMEDSSDLFLLLNTGKSLALEGGGGVRIVSKTEVEGYNISGGFCGESNRQTVYFVARFNKPAVEQGIWKGRESVTGRSLDAENASLGAWLRFELDSVRTVLVKVGISYVSVSNARSNLDAEIPHWDFDRIHSEARAEWETALSRIQIDDMPDDRHVKFYTALYHSLIHPNIISDVNGDFPLMGRTGTGNSKKEERYSVFSLWDTYRTLHPLLTLMYPERASAMVRTMVEMYRESGWLPKWELAANETRMMVGDPAVPVIADTYLKGVRDFDIHLAFEALLKHARESEKQSGPIRPGYHEQMRYGYIPSEQDTTEDWWVWGPASNTLEYCFADWAFSRLANELGKAKIVAEFLGRSMFYRNLFDTTLQFIRPKRKDGTWLTPFNPLATEGSGSWSGSGGPGYVEGNAWNYTWFVPHDVRGLAGLFGGEKQLVQKLRECFDKGLFTIGNEPDIAYPYLFSYFPKYRDLTAKYVQEIMAKSFGTGPNGLPGDDDAGAISAWYVFSALGFFPACPGSNEYRLGIPLFQKASLELNNKYYPGNGLVIEMKRSSRSARTSFSGKLLEGGIGHGELVSGGRLVFERND